MTDETHDGAMSTGNIFYDEAADWFARMRGPDADLHRAAFEAWLERGALHRAAYNRVAEIFTDSCRFVGAEPKTPARTSRLAASVRRSVGAVLVAIVVALSVAMSFHLYNRPAEGIKEAEPQGQLHHSYASAVGEIRRVSLPDGSRVSTASGQNDIIALLFGRNAGGARHLLEQGAPPGARMVAAACFGSGMILLGLSIGAAYGRTAIAERYRRWRS